MMRPGWKWLVALAAGIAFTGTTQAITLYRSNSLAMYTLEVPDGVRNDQPVNFLDPDSLAQLLASLQLQSKEAGGPIYLMSESLAIKAATELSKALARIDGSRDVLFVAYRNVGSFPSVRRLASASRVFVNDDGLNLIFGQVDDFVDEFREPYLKRARPGNRAKEDLAGGTLIAADWFRFKPGRNDWVIYPIDTKNSPRTTLRLKPANESGVRQAVPVAPAPAAPSAPVRATPPALPTTPKAAPSDNRWLDLEQGMETLQRLRDKGLINEREYELKRRQLLDAVKL